MYQYLVFIFYTFAVQNEPASQSGPEQLSGQSQPQLVIWGTDVVVSECKTKFKRFIMRYIDPDVQEDEVGNNTDLNEPLYMQKLEEVCKNSFNVPIIKSIKTLT